MPQSEYTLKILDDARDEIHKIAKIHLELVGSHSARKITVRLRTALENLKTNPKMGIVCREESLALAGYRMLICGNYLCFYRQLGNSIFVYHVVDGRTDYGKLLMDLERT